MFLRIDHMFFFVGLALMLVVWAGCSDDENSRDDDSPNQTEDVVSADTTGDAGAQIPDTFVDAPSDFGLPCESNSDCSSGFCVQSPEGFICTIPCLEECPPGFSCKAISNLRPDIVFICFPDTHVDECHVQPDGADCDDGNACTEEDYCAEGFCQGGVTIDCDDGDPCTAHSCNFKSGCEYIWAEGDCDDLNPCTQDDSCQNGVCVGGTTLDCAVDDICMEGYCDPEEGCIAVEKDCDDGIETTLDICLEDGCNNIDGCSELVIDDVLCEMHGSVGELVKCPIQIARGDANEVNAHGLQFYLNYPASQAKLTHFTSCPDCLDYVPPMTSLPTGHFVGMAPPNINDWDGSGQLILANLSSTAPLTTAFVVNEQVEGDAIFMTGHFVLQADISESQPIELKLGQIFVSDASAAPLKINRRRACPGQDLPKT